MRSSSLPGSICASALFHVLDMRRDHRLVDVFHRRRDVGQNGQALGRDLDKAAEHDDALRSAAGMHGENARPQQRDERGMAGEHAEIALASRHIDLLDFAGK